MWLKVMDNKAYFATHFIHVEAIDEIREKINLQVEKTGIVCYSIDELNKAKQTLDELGANYIVEELNIDPILVAKAQGVKYLMPEEVKKHLLEDIEPESMLISNLKKKLTEKEAEVSNLKAEMEKLKASVEQIKGKIMPPS